MKHFYFLFTLLFISECIAQQPLFRSNKITQHDLNIIADTPHLFVDDSVYVIEGLNVKVYKSNRFNDLDLIHIEDSIYKIPGGGSLYKMDATYAFKRMVHKPKMEQSFFKASTFIRKDTVFQYGGYGNFSHKNDLIFYDKKLDSWEFYPYDPANKMKPKEGAPQLFSSNNKSLIVMGLYSESKDGRQDENELLREVWRFSFRDKTWSKLGDYDFMETFRDDIKLINKVGTKYYARTSFNNILEIDLEKSSWVEYQDLTSSNTKIRAIQYAANYFFFILQNTKNSIELFRVKKEKFLGPVIKRGTIIQTNKGDAFKLGLLVLLLGGVSLFLITRKRNKNILEVLLKFKEENIILLSKNEIRLLDALVASHPNAVSYKDISSYFDSTLNFETKKIKTRTLINELKRKLEKQLNLSNILVIKKNMEDKRAKEVFINDK